MIGDDISARRVTIFVDTITLLFQLLLKVKPIKFRAVRLNLENNK